MDDYLVMFYFNLNSIINTKREKVTKNLSARMDIDKILFSYGETNIAVVTILFPNMKNGKAVLMFYF